MLLTSAYFPPVEYFAVMAKGMTLSADRVIPSVVHIEACEHYQKQSYRNRCKFYAENGVQTLSVPVVHQSGTYELPITEIKVDYSTPWIVRSERAIEAAYWSSPFFEYYRDELFAIMDSETETLFDLNLKLIRFFLEKLHLPVEIRFTETFEPKGSLTYGEDLRDAIHPKRPNSILQGLGLDKPYYQVFAQKHGFIPNLSILDLLFNEGPDSISHLHRQADDLKK